MNEDEIWNGKQQASNRLRNFSALVGNRLEVEIDIPQIGVILPDLDIQLLGRDLGWGYSQDFTLNMFVTDLLKDSHVATQIRKVFTSKKISELLPSEEMPRFVVACTIRHKNIDNSNLAEPSDKLEALIHQPGDFTFYINKNGQLINLIVTKFPDGVIEPDSFGGAELKIDSSQSLSPDLLDETHTNESKTKLVKSIDTLTSRAIDMGLGM